MNNVYILANGNKTIGFGHISRSAALASYLKNSFSVSLITTSKLQELNQFSSKFSSILSIDSFENYSLLFELINPGDLLVLDGYYFTIEFQKEVKRNNKVILIDDFCTGHYIADVLINQAPMVKELDYKKEKYTKTYLGPEYAIVNEEFTLFEGTKEAVIDGNVCVCFGGVDSLNLSLKALQLLQNVDAVKSISLVIGSSNENSKQLKEYGLKSKKPIEIFQGVSSIDLAGIVGNCSMAFVSASVILYEVLTINKPLLVGWYVDNQRLIYEGFVSLEIVKGVGDLRDIEKFDKFNAHCTFLLTDLKGQNEMIKKQKRIFDGKASTRVLSLFEDL